MKEIYRHLKRTNRMLIIMMVFLVVALIFFLNLIFG